MTPIDWSVVGGTLFTITTGTVKWLVPAVREMLRPQPAHSNGGSSTKTLEARLAGGEAATLLGEVREARRTVEETERILKALADSAESSAELLKQITAANLRTDERWRIIADSTEATNRMLQLHTGLLDHTSLQVDALHANLQKKRGKR